MLELTHVNPDWFGELSVALIRPAGQPERRHGQDPWQQRGHDQRPRRVADDLAWLRVAFCNPELHGLHPAFPRARDRRSAPSAAFMSAES